MLERLPTMVQAYDASGNLVMWNAESARVTGYSREELARAPEVLKSLIPAALRNSANRVPPESRIADLKQRECRITCKNGSVRTVLWTELSGKIPVTGWSSWSMGTDLTPPGESNDSLRETDELNRHILDAVPGGVVFISTDAKLLRANAEAQRLLGLTYNRVDQMYVADFQHRTYREDGTECPIDEYPVSKCLATGQAQPPTTVGVQRPDGSRVWAVFRAIPYYDPQTGILAGAVVTFLDVSERKQTEDALRVSEEKMRSILDTALNLILTLDRDGRVLFINRVVSGRSQEEIIGREAVEFLPAEFQERFRSAIKGVFETGEVDEFETMAPGPAQSQAWYLLRMGPIMSEGQVTAVTVCATDMTEHRRVETALRAGERRFRLAVDNYPGIFVIYDAQRRLQFVNRRCVELHGSAEADMLGRTDEELFPQDFTACYLSVLKRAVETRLPQSTEFTFRMSAGLFTLIANFVPLVDELGELVEILGFTFDITDRRRAEEEKLAAQRQLMEHQRQSRERVEVELARVRADLIRQTRLATIGQMSAQIAHDLRNPLGAVRNAAFFLQRKAPSGEPYWEEYLQLIQEEVSICDRIINMLLDVTRGREPSRETTNLCQLVQDAATRLDLPAGITFTCECNPETFLIYADPIQLRQLFDNLIKNAIDALEGFGEIHVQAVRSGEVDTIVVRDSGTGIPPGLRESIFELFYTTKARGTGLGLVICRQIAERHGGTLELLETSRPETCFRIQLPRVTPLSPDATN